MSGNSEMLIEDKLPYDHVKGAVAQVENHLAAKRSVGDSLTRRQITSSNLKDDDDDDKDDEEEEQNIAIRIKDESFVSKSPKTSLQNPPPPRRKSLWRYASEDDIKEPYEANLQPTVAEEDAVGDQPVEKNLKHGVFKHVMDGGRIETQKFLYIPPEFTFEDSDFDDLLKVFEMNRPLLFFNVDYQNEIFDIQDTWSKGCMFPFDFDMSSSEWAMHLAGQEVQFKKEVVHDKTRDFIRAIGDVCKESSTWVVVNTPTESNRLGTFVAQNVSADVTFGIYDDEALKDDAVFQKVVMAARKTGVDIDEEPSVIAKFSHQGVNPLKDKYPSPKLKKIIIGNFLSIQSFLEALKKKAHEGALSIGGTHFHFNRLKDYVQQGTNTVLILKRTGGAASIFSEIISLRSKKVEKLLSDEQVMKEFEDRFSILDQYQKTQSKVLLSNWPEGFDHRHVLILDPLESSPSDKLDLITQTISSAFEASKELGSKISERNRLRYVTEKINTLEYNVKAQRRIATLMQFTLILFTFIIIVSAVLNYLFPEIGSYLYYVNVIVPLASTFLFAIYSKFGPFTKWAEFLACSRYLESELYHYVCRVGQYSSSSSLGENQDSVKHRPASNIFSSNVRAVWERLSDYSGYLNKPPSSWKSKDPLRIAAINLGYQDNVILGPDDYLNERLKPVLESMKSRAKGVKIAYALLQFSVFFFTAICALLAAFNFANYVPISMSIAIFFASISNQWQFERRMQGLNLAISELEKAYSWWVGLSLLERRMHVNKNILVEICEWAVNADLSAYVNSLNKASKRISAGADFDLEKF
jgi:hypothetical protein